MNDGDRGGKFSFQTARQAKLKIKDGRAVLFPPRQKAGGLRAVGRGPYAGQFCAAGLHRRAKQGPAGGIAGQDHPACIHQQRRPGGVFQTKYNIRLHRSNVIEDREITMRALNIKELNGTAGVVGPGPGAP